MLTALVILCQVTVGGTPTAPIRKMVPCATVERVCEGGPRFGGPRCAWRKVEKPT
jgi:hypothetical protein